MQYRNRISLLIVSALLLGISAAPAPAEPSAPVVVELFTSQGCSSCPPADALLGELIHDPNVIALAFHVDYWDSIGWRDGYSIPEATRRQNAYVHALGLSSAFTPQLVIDGRTSLVGSDRVRILGALTTRRETMLPTAVVDQGELRITLPDGNPRGNFDVNLAAYLPQGFTSVLRGENAGRRLAEYNIVRQFRRVGGWDGHETTFRVPLDSFPADTTRVAILLQAPAQGPIIGSAVARLR
jgi:hypothetical protein